MIDDVKKLLGSEKLIVGAKETLKALRAGTLAKVFLATNPSPDLKADIEHYASISGVEVLELGVPNDELGTLCKKPFAISVLGQKK